MDRQKYEEALEAIHAAMRTGTAGDLLRDDIKYAEERMETDESFRKAPEGPDFNEWIDDQLTQELWRQGHLATDKAEAGMPATALGHLGKAVVLRQELRRRRQLDH